MPNSENLNKVTFPHSGVIHELLDKVSRALRNRQKAVLMPDNREVNRDVAPKTFKIVTAEYW